MNATAIPSIGTARFGTWLLLTAVVMLFAGFASAYTVLQGGPGWQAFEVPGVLWTNTGVLLLSSAALEWARRSPNHRGLRVVRFRLAVTLLLGSAFLLGQISAWQDLREAGVHLSTGAAAAFFYILTGAHGLHLTGGIFALGYALAVPRREIVRVTAMYWHFMDALWLVLLFLIAG